MAIIYTNYCCHIRLRKAVVELNEKKIRSLRFDNLNGDTPLQRLTVLLRRRNIRNLALLMLSILAFCIELSILYYISRLYGEAAGGFLIVLVSLSIIALIYLPVLLWLIILVFKPDKCYCMRRLKRLGDVKRFAIELEEDLAAEGGVLFQKGSLCVTKRFIIEANLFCYRMYPLMGLCEFDCQTALFLPAFRYGNGTKIRMATRVPFRMLRSYIGPEVKVNIGIEKPEDTVNVRTEMPKPRKKDIVGFVIFILLSGALFYLSESAWGIRTVALCCCGALMLLIIMIVISEILKPEETGNKKVDTFIGSAMFFCPAAIPFYFVYFNKLPTGLTYAAALYSLGMLLWLSSFSVRDVMRDKNLKRTLAELKDPGERIRKMEELCAAGFYKNRVLYLNELSGAYYDKQDTRKALELIREACREQSGKREYSGALGMTVSEMLRLNEITYLVALKRFDEAEALLALLDDKQYKNSVALYLNNANRAELAIWKRDTRAAREFLIRVTGLSYKNLTEERRINISCHLLLLEAECNLLEGDTAAALIKLDDILTRSTWQANVEHAAELKETVLRKNSGARKRKHGLYAYQAVRRSSPRYAAARRKVHRLS